METIIVNGEQFEIPVEVKDLIDGSFNKAESLRVELCKILDLDYLMATDDDIIEAVKKLTFV